MYITARKQLRRLERLLREARRGSVILPELDPTLIHWLGRGKAHRMLVTSRMLDRYCPTAREFFESVRREYTEYLATHDENVRNLVGILIRSQGEQTPFARRAVTDIYWLTYVLIREARALEKPLLSYRLRRIAGQHRGEVGYKNVVNHLNQIVNI